jgi:acyl-CoA thioester hydrolase
MSVAGPSQGARPPPGGGGAKRRSGRELTSAGGRPFSFPVRVYYEDTDAAGVVYYANYLKFMERARTEWLASLGFPLAAFESEHGVAFVVHRAEIDFLAPARLNDRLDVTVEPAERGASRLVAMQEVRRGPVALTRARVALACVDTARWKPARMPKPLQHALETLS